MNKPKQKIICSRCEKLLEPGAGPPVLKVCPDCVRDMYPGADLSKIAKPGLVDEHGESFENQANAMLKPTEPQFSVDHEIYTVDGTTVLVFKVIGKNNGLPLLEFGASLKELKEIVEKMETIDEKYNKEQPPGEEA